MTFIRIVATLGQLALLAMGLIVTLTALVLIASIAFPGLLDVVAK
jgi:hypothetical protein